jgi:hypothetical protein
MSAAAASAGARRDRTRCRFDPLIRSTPKFLVPRRKSRWRYSTRYSTRSTAHDKPLRFDPSLRPTRISRRSRAAVLHAEYHRDRIRDFDPPPRVTTKWCSTPNTHGSNRRLRPVSGSKSPTRVTPKFLDENGRAVLHPRSTAKSTVLSARGVTAGSSGSRPIKQFSILVTGRYALKRADSFSHGRSRRFDPYCAHWKTASSGRHEVHHARYPVARLRSPTRVVLSAMSPFFFRYPDS